MANLLDVADIIQTISDTFEDAVLQCMDQHKFDVTELVREQLYSGVDGNGAYLSPTYSQDPWFNSGEAGWWEGQAEQYRKWKEHITPPETSELLHLPPRPVDVPNLFITGEFHRSIQAELQLGLHIYTFGFYDGPAIERKYGEQILMPGERARVFFNEQWLKPWLMEFFIACGYK